MRQVCVLALAAFVMGCDAPVRTVPQAPGQAGGAEVQSFTLTRVSNARVIPVSERAIAARARAICPGGHREITRSAEASRQVSGLIYTDVKVTLTCV